MEEQVNCLNCSYTIIELESLDHVEIILDFLITHGFMDGTKCSKCDNDAI